MYNAQFPNPQQAGPGQMMPPGGAMPMNPGAMPPGGMPPGGAMPPAMGAPGGGMAGPMGQQIDPAVIQQILALQSQQGRRAGVDRQMALADQLRADANSQLQGRRTGIANVGAAALNGYAARKQMEGAEAKGSQLDSERQAGAGKFFDLIRGLRESGAGGGGGMGFGGLM